MPSSARPRRAAPLLLLPALFALLGCPVSHGPSTYEFGGHHCSEINPKQNLWYHVNGGTCAVFKVSDSTFAAVMVKSPKADVSGTVELWASVDGGKAMKVKSKRFSVEASTKATVIVSGTLAGAKKKTYIVEIDVPSGTPKFDFTVAVE